MGNNSKTIEHPRADFYIVFPFYVTNWDSFSQGLSSAGIWEPVTNPSRQTLKNVINSYLGEDAPREFPLQAGMAYLGKLHKSSNRSLSSFTGEVAFKNARGELIFKNGDLVRSFWPEFEIGLHIAPNRHSGVAVFCLSTGNCSLKEAVEINYAIQKCDDELMPTLCSFRGGDWISCPGRSTLKELFMSTLPEAVAPDNEARFLMASCVMVDTSGGRDDNSLRDGLTRLGLVQGWSYNIDDKEKQRCQNLFENIWTYASHEGFATIAMTPDVTKEKFFGDFHARFPKSYLPIYLANILAEMTYRSALGKLDMVALSPDEQDRIQETRVMLGFEPSPYTHLIRLMDSIKTVWHFDEKFDVIMSSIGARIARLEVERLKVEKTNQQLAIQRKAEAEEATKRRDEEMAREKAAREKRDRDINILLGFMGIGQVVFGILQLLGVETIGGLRVATSPVLKIISIVLSAAFFILIMVILIKVVFRRRLE